MYRMYDKNRFRDINKHINMHYGKKIHMLCKKRKDTDASAMLFVQLNTSA